VANETMNDFEGYIKVGIMKNDFSVLFEDKVSFLANALSSYDVKSYPNDELKSSKDTYFYAELYTKDGKLLARNTEISTKPKYFKFLKPTINVNAFEKEDGILLTFNSDVFVKSLEVSFKNHDIKLSDNYFDLISANNYTVFAHTSLSKDEVLKDISLMSVYDIPLRY
jgi:hypothetical protein